MMKGKIIVAMLCIAALPQLLGAQCVSNQKRPAWVDGYFHEATNSYVESVTATGSSEAEARDKAARIVIERRGLATGLRSKIQVNGNNVVVTGSDELTVKSRVLDEYREECPSEYRVSLLVQTAKNPTYDFERVKVTNDYGSSVRAFIPGMAQLHKGSKGKGIFFITAEALCVGGIVLSESMRASYTSKINTTHDVGAKQTYIDNADSWSNIRNGFIAGAAIVYVWNVIDGLVAKGDKHVQILGMENMKLMPYTTPREGGLYLSFNF